MIRTANIEDEPAIRDCSETAYDRYVAAIGRKPAPMVSDFSAQIGSGHIHVTMDAKNRLQGFIVFYPNGGQMLLENVAVLPMAAGKGVGKSLIRFCEDEARRLGLSAVTLYTNEKMTENLTIYPQLGYREVDRREEDGFNRVYFEKRLD